MYDALWAVKPWYCVPVRFGWGDTSPNENNTNEIKFKLWLQTLSARPNGLSLLDLTPPRSPPPLPRLLLRPAGWFRLSPLPFDSHHRLGNGGQLVGRKTSPTMLEVRRPNWRVCERDYSCRETSPETTWIPWMIRLRQAGRDTVEQRVSCWFGWVKGLAWLVQAWMLRFGLLNREEVKEWREWMRRRHAARGSVLKTKAGCLVTTL